MSSEPPQRPIQDYLKLYLILETSLLRLPLGDFIVQAIEGGVTAIQLRDKIETPHNRYETAKSLVSLLKGRDVLFFINNSADLALAVGAHGVHVGEEDLPPSAIRKTFPDLMVGYSCNNDRDISVAVEAGVHYAGVGPVFFTATKNNLRPILGVEGMAAVVNKLNIPAVAIGGINEETIPLLAGKTGAGIAVSSALCHSETPYDTALNMRRLMDSYERV